jgi:hypothetical protein
LAISSKFTQHLLKDGHIFGPIESIMGILSFNKKVIHLDTKEIFCIYNEATFNNEVTDKHII